ncbi:MAG: aromatic acid decarboxylase [Methanomethylophilus alvi]|nr:MAG: aromatic acid decarboxylase [Methanomethylophilus alvi]WII09501.1 UbiX family flavin prenyltransferase [Methanomassiliicoccales archaeon LGM-DZ1]
MKSVVAMTGASGAIYGIRLLQELPGEKILVMSDTAKKIIPAETGHSVEEVEKMADEVYSQDDLMAPIASGTFDYDIMFVVPCTESSVAKFAAGMGDDLISRAFMCALKEGRKTVLVPRETPKSAIMLENELKLARLGVVILDANPAFYPNPKTVSDMVDFIVGRCLMQAGIDQDLFERWGSSD